MKTPIIAAMCLMLAPFIAHAADEAGSYTPPTIEHTAPDDTKINKRDRENQTLTPGNQSNKKADIKITQAIRKSILKHHLSTDAKNIKIITINGDVTLRGPVNNTAEIEKINKLAKTVAGIKTINNQLEVK